MKTYIITGASKGIGYQTALSLLKKNHRVVAIARSADKLIRLQLESNSPNLITITADLTLSDDIESIKEKISQLAPISGLINNAGVVLNKSFEETNIAEWRSVFEVNVFSSVQLTQSLLPYMAKESHILNISSMGGFQGSSKFAGLSAYSASKGALAILTECLSTELTSSKIAVNCLCLGAVQTEMLAEAFPGYEAPVKPEQMGEYISDFIVSGHQFFNGKILPVALNNPD
tara:strand:+ start:12482 stop:13174 length:693 start_codon:yes stop_codon:yes gene_type:complete